MDAVEYLRQFYRMCDSNKYCSSCEAIGICENDCEKAEQMVEIVEEWAKEHKVKEHNIKTNQSEFLKMFPYALTLFGVVDILPCNIDARKYKDDECKKFLSCEDCRRKYWREEIE